MKKLLLTLSMALFYIPAATVAQDMPQPSPFATFTQKVGVTEVALEYSRPGVKGRKIWGELVPYHKLWRAGANASTKIKFSTEVTINNVKIAPGEYALFIIPTEESWTFVINKNTDTWGTNGYDEKDDVVRVMAIPEKHSFTETMLFALDEVTDSTAMVNLYWENLKVGFKLSVNTNELVNEMLEGMIKEADNSFRTYYRAADWFLKHNGDKAKALELAKKSVDMDKRFWNLTVLAEAYAANGDKKTAVKLAKEALELSEKAEYQSYIDRNKANIKKWEGK